MADEVTVVERRDMSDRGGTIIIQSKSQEATTGTAARQLAISTAAAAGISKAGISEMGSPYPVDANGETSEDLLFAKPGTKVEAYRCDIRVAGGA